MVRSVHRLEFETLHNYGREKDRIEVPITLRSGEGGVSFPAQLDTGATYCVFERTYGTSNTFSPTEESILISLNLRTTVS
jgi:hypothetical protein